MNENLEMDLSNNEVDVQLDEQWERMFQKNGVLIVQGSPPGLEFGIDMNSYETGPNFGGISMIPEGLHLIYFGTMNSPRDGIFFSVDNTCQLLFKVWDDNNHTLVDGLSTLTEEGVINLKKAILSGAFNTKLAPYPQEQQHLWRNLSLYVNVGLLKSCQIPLNTTFTMQENIEFTPSEQKILGKLAFTQSNRQNPLNLPVPQLTNFQQVESKFIEKHFYELSLQPNKLNEMKLDKSYLIDLLLQQQHQHFLSIHSFFGELQLSFLLFLLLISFQSLKSWKYLLSLLMNSEKYWKSHVKLLKQFLLLFFHQLKFLSHDFLENEISKQEFLLPLLTSLFTLLNELTSPLLISEQLQKKRKSIQAWNDEDEEEDLPPATATTSTTAAEETTKTQDLEELLELQLRLNKFLDKKFHITFYQQKTEIPSSAPPNTSLSSSNVLSPSPIPFIEERMIAQSAGNGREYADDDLIEGVNGGRFLPQRTEEETGEGSPMRVDVQEEQQQEHHTPHKEVEPVDLSHITITPENRQELKFNWRYPLLSEAMKATGHGQEDMLMTAMRILDETEENFQQKLKEGVDEEERLKDAQLLLRNEAITFITNETQFL